eukprot:Rhum_TRINITY_DN14425_c19_g1::Rhum_TRINITY_DN14425_c19_g1_i1::g.90165::m.90165
MGCGGGSSFFFDNETCETQDTSHGEGRGGGRGRVRRVCECAEGSAVYTCSSIVILRVANGIEGILRVVYVQLPSQHGQVRVRQDVRQRPVRVERLLRVQRTTVERIPFPRVVRHQVCLSAHAPKPRPRVSVRVRKRVVGVRIVVVVVVVLTQGTAPFAAGVAVAAVAFLQDAVDDVTFAVVVTTLLGVVEPRVVLVLRILRPVVVDPRQLLEALRVHTSVLDQVLHVEVDLEPLHGCRLRPVRIRREQLVGALPHHVRVLHHLHALRLRLPVRLPHQPFVARRTQRRRAGPLRLRSTPRRNLDDRAVAVGPAGAARSVPATLDQPRRLVLHRQRVHFGQRPLARRRRGDGVGAGSHCHRRLLLQLEDPKPARVVAAPSKVAHHALQAADAVVVGIHATTLPDHKGFGAGFVGEARHLYDKPPWAGLPQDAAADAAAAA